MTGEDAQFINKVTERLRAPTPVEMWLLVVAGLAVLAYISLAILVVGDWK